MSVDELWRELGSTMRMLRMNAGTSLRQVEIATGRGRGLLSQIENAKARAPRDLVEWYDTNFGGDGLLISIYAEARGAHGTNAAGRSPAVYVVSGDSVAVELTGLPSGQRVEPGSQVTAAWTLVNTGIVPWRGRSLRRVGAVIGARLLASPSAVLLPDAEPGDRVDVTMPLDVPPHAGTYAAYWEVTDSHGRRCFGRGELVAVTLVADW